MGSYKKMIAVFAVFLGLSFAANAATPVLQPGKWNGVVKKSVSPDLKGKKFTATTEVKGDKTWITVVMDGAKGKESEVWEVKGDTLIQTEYDADGKVVGEPYRAIAQGGTDMEKTFYINCKNKVANQCDNGIDANNTWTLKFGGNKFTYIVKGKLDKNNPQSKIGERHNYEFQFAGK